MTAADPLLAHAAARGLVRLPDGRTARLHYWPATVEEPSPDRRRRSTGGRARVRLPSGAWLSVPVDQITVVAHHDDDTSRPVAAPAPPERTAHA